MAIVLIPVAITGIAAATKWYRSRSVVEDKDCSYKSGNCYCDIKEAQPAVIELKLIFTDEDKDCSCKSGNCYDCVDCPLNYAFIGDIPTCHCVVDEPQTVVDEPQTIVDELQPIVDEPQPIVDEQQSIVDELQSIVDELQSIVDECSCFDNDHFGCSTCMFGSSIDLTKCSCTGKPFVDELQSVIEHKAPSVQSTRSKSKRAKQFVAKQSVVKPRINRFKDRKQHRPSLADNKIFVRQYEKRVKN